MAKTKQVDKDTKRQEQHGERPLVDWTGLDWTDLASQACLKKGKNIFLS